MSGMMGADKGGGGVDSIVGSAEVDDAACHGNDDGEREDGNHGVIMV